MRLAQFLIGEVMARASKPSCDQEEKAEKLADSGPVSVQCLYLGVFLNYVRKTNPTVYCKKKL